MQTMSFFVLLFALVWGFIGVPPVIPKESGGIVVSDKNGVRRWTADWTMEPVELNGQKAVRFTEKGKGRISPYSQDVQWSLNATWLAQNGFRPLDTEKTISSSSGTLIATERKHFDSANGSVRFERTPAGGKPEVQSLKAPTDTLAVEGIAGVLRFLPFEGAGALPAHMLTNEPKLYTVTFKVRGKEKVRTAAGEFECYKVELVPQLGVLSVFRSLVPKAFFWFSVAPPHFFVRYEGPENGPGTPDVIMELKNAPPSSVQTSAKLESVR